MDLVVDVGNTRAKLALVAGGVVVARAAAPHADLAALAAAADALLDQTPGAGPGGVARAALASVHPAGRAAVEAWARGRGLTLRALGEDLPAPIPLRVPDPRGVGPDRVADASWAARTLPGALVVVVDCGTAITLNVVGPDGAFLGGAIAPGLRTAAWALHARTAALPEVAPAAIETVLGVDTRTNIEVGLLCGAGGLVDAFCAGLEAERGVAPIVVATGGDAALVAARAARRPPVVPDLTLLGVAFALAAAP